MPRLDDCHLIRLPIRLPRQATKARTRTLRVPNAGGLARDVDDPRSIRHDASYEAVMRAPDAQAIGLLRRLPKLSEAEQLAVVAAVVLRFQSDLQRGWAWSPVHDWLLKRPRGWGGAMGARLVSVAWRYEGRVYRWAEGAKPAALRIALQRSGPHLQCALLEASLSNQRLTMRTQSRLEAQYPHARRALQRNIGRWPTTSCC